MQKASHISLIITLLTALMLLAGPRCAHAQNSGAFPYLDSKHDYEIQIGKHANDRRWVLTTKPADGSFPYTVEKADYNNDGLDWFEVTAASADRGYERVTITFDRTVFATGTYYLQYFEYEDVGSSKICVSARELEIVITENTFYLTVDANGSLCNGETGKVHAYEDFFTDAGLTIPRAYPTTVEYTVFINKSADFDPDSVIFNAGFAVGASAVAPTDFTAAVTAPAIGYKTVFSGTGANRRVVVTPEPTSNDFADQVTVTLTVTFENPVLSDISPALTVSSGKAVKIGTPPAPDAHTPDNITIYPVDNEGDRTQEILVRALPDTRNIAHGEGETAATASNPLQYSTHKYTVLLSDIGNLSNGATGWNLRTAGGDAVTTGFTITRSASATADTAIVELNMDPGYYVLYFTEESDDGCRTVRPYPFRLHAPFDVDIALNDPGNDAERCAGVSGTVNNDLGTATQTVIAYTVEVNTADYLSGWSFSYEVSTNVAGGFDAGDVEVAAVNVTGGTHTSGSATTGSVTVAGGTTEVTVSVTYRGFYLNEHTLKVALSSITGSFKETDADAVNETTNILNPMPQPGVLAGVE